MRVRVSTKQPIAVIDGHPIYPHRSTYADRYDLGNYIQLRVNAINPDYRVTHHDNGLAIMRGQDESQVVEVEETQEDDADEPRRGPAGPIGHVVTSLPFIYIIIVGVGVIAIIIAFGNYLDKIDRSY